MRKTPEQLLFQVGELAFTSKMKPSTAAVIGIGALVGVTLIEKLSPKVSKFVGQVIRQVRLANVALPHVPALAYPEAEEVFSVNLNERQEGRSEVIRAIARGRSN